MYIPKHFDVTDRDEIFSFIDAHGFGQLISSVEGEPFVSHLPFEATDDRAGLVCHLARNNPQLGELEGQEVLVTFQGPHGYISPTWYTTPRVPPTWNYQAVHVRGTCRLFDKPELLRASIEGMAQRYERTFEHPWQPEYDPAMLRGIVGVDITITDLQCKYKLSQNRSAEDRSGVVAELEQRGFKQLAEAMARISD